jgi:hypothetical protein
MFLRNVRKYLLGYTASRFRQQFHCCDLLAGNNLVYVLGPQTPSYGPEKFGFMQVTDSQSGLQGPMKSGGNA